jgi:RNA polymerase sigma-70 factor (ECF subfamily)
MINAVAISWEEWVTPSEVAKKVLAVQSGDLDAFALLLASYKNRLFRYLLRWVHETATAEDLFQQTWMRVIEKIQGFDPERNFDAWLFAVARNLTIDYLRRRHPESLHEPSGDDPALLEQLPAHTAGALDSLLHGERITLVQRALESQPPIYREILTLRFEEEMKLDEIAEILAIPLSTVKTRLGRGLDRLRKTFLRMQLENIAQ